MIGPEENKAGQLERLAAQRELYSRAKTILTVQMLLAGPVAIGIAIVVAFVPSLRVDGAAWGIFVALADVLCLTPWQSKLREMAAKIQEMFDCDVFDLKWNEVKVGARPDPELVKANEIRYRPKAAKMPTLVNWYPPIVDDLPIHLARLACQRSNCWWDSNQRRRYASFVVAMLATIFIALLAISLASDFSLEKFILTVLTSVAPALVVGIRQYVEQTTTAQRMDQVKAHAERLWREALKGSLSITQATLASRTLQDEIFDNRKRSPLIFDLAFKLLRPDYQTQMEYGVADMVEEAKRSGV